MEGLDELVYKFNERRNTSYFMYISAIAAGGQVTPNQELEKFYSRHRAKK